MNVLVFGTFDHLHPGHRFVLDTAQNRGEMHVVVARDTTVERIKGKKPRENEQERTQAIHNAYPAATVHLGDVSDFFQPIHAMKPDLILLGYDQRMPPGIQEEDLPCPIERLQAFEPERWKSSLMQE